MLLEALPTPFPCLFQEDRWRNNFVWWKVTQEGYKASPQLCFPSCPQALWRGFVHAEPWQQHWHNSGSSAGVPANTAAPAAIHGPQESSTQGPELVPVLEHWGNNGKLSGLGKRTGKGSENVERQDLSASILKRSCLSAGTTDLPDRNHPHPPQGCFLDKNTEKKHSKTPKLVASTS